MAVQAPLFSENLGLQDWIFAGSSGYGLPDPFTTPVQSFQIQANQPVSSQLFDFRLVSGEFERQKREIDLFLHLQNEKLKYAIQEQKKQQLSYMLRSLESKSAIMIKKIEQDLAEAKNRARELEDCLKKAEMEAGVWQRIAKENEEMIMGLNSMLGQAQERLYWAGSSGGPAQDAESVCETSGEEEDDKMGCKWCRKQRSCVVFLPCRHLCACRDCGSVLEMCPVCQTVKEAGIEVFLS